MSKKIKVKKLEGSSYAVQSEITGKGATASIVRAYNLDNLSEQLVSKVISVTEEENSGVCRAQLQVLKELPAHPNLVNYKKIQISSEHNLYLIMQFCNGGNLDKFLFDCKYHLHQDKIWFFLKQFCDGYQVLYNSKLVHRDIKPENILLHNGNFKIADFGLSKLISNPEITENFSVKGTPIYMAPELPQFKEGTSKIDVFSLGVVLYRMAFKGEYPFFDQGRKYRSVAEYFRELKIRKLIIPNNHGRSPDMIELITRMLAKDPEQRIGWKEIFELPKIVKAVRCQRKREMTSMEDFKRSLIFVNKSMVHVQEEKEESEIKETGKETEDDSLIIEEAFNKTGKSQFQCRLYRSKLMYTLIEHANFKIRKYLQRQQGLHPLLKVKLTHIVKVGLEFGLYVIESLRDLSGEWEAFTPHQILNFENIFENDRIILEEELQRIAGESAQQKSKQSSTNGNEMRSRPKKIVKLTYEDLLYTFLTDYPQYPKQLRSQLLALSVLLVDIYDLVLKFEVGKINNEKDILQAVEDSEISMFYQYLLSAQKITEAELFCSMEEKGLIFK